MRALELLAQPQRPSTQVAIRKGSFFMGRFLVRDLHMKVGPVVLAPQGDKYVE
jgi:hypothetical protein